MESRSFGTQTFRRGDGHAITGNEGTQARVASGVAPLVGVRVNSRNYHSTRTATAFTTSDFSAGVSGRKANVVVECDRRVRVVYGHDIAVHGEADARGRHCCLRAVTKGKGRGVI